MALANRTGHRLANTLSFLAGWLTAAVALVAIIIFVMIISTDDPRAKSALGQRHQGEIAVDELDSLVWSLAYSPDGVHLASATITGDVCLKNLQAQKTTRILRGAMGSALSLNFSPDGTVLAVAGGERVLQMWDVVSESELPPFEVGSKKTKDVVFSPVGGMLAVGESDGGRVTLWDWVKRRRLAVLDGHLGAINTLAFSPDGKRLAVGDSAGDTTLWDLNTREVRIRLRTHRNGEVVLAFSPDGNQLATAGNCDVDVQLWDLPSGYLREKIPSSVLGISSIAFSPDGSLLAMASAGDGMASLWGLTQGKPCGAIRASGGSFQSIAFSRDGKELATGGSDGALRIWDVSSFLAGKHEDVSKNE